MRSTPLPPKRKDRKDFTKEKKRKERKRKEKCDGERGGWSFFFRVRDIGVCIKSHLLSPGACVIPWAFHEHFSFLEEI